MSRAPTTAPRRRIGPQTPEEWSGAVTEATPAMQAAGQQLREAIKRRRQTIPAQIQPKP